MFLLQFLSKLLKILRSGATPGQIAGGFILGMIIGLTPSFINPITLFVILLIIVLNVNIATALFSLAVFKGIAYLADPAFHSLGYAVLVDLKALRGLWTTLYNIPFVPFTRFNNTVEMGSLIVAIILLIPVFWAIKKFVIQYREKYEPKVQNWKWIKLMKASGFYKLYERLKFLGD
jgi:uncharacterized protein (TIGR03546 family)